jgi:hypothetical protein
MTCASWQKQSAELASAICKLPSFGVHQAFCRYHIDTTLLHSCSLISYHLCSCCCCCCPCRWPLLPVINLCFLTPVARVLPYLSHPASVLLPLIWRVQAGGGHDSIEDARAALQLYDKYKQLLAAGTLNVGVLPGSQSCWKYCGWGPSNIVHVFITDLGIISKTWVS